MCNIIMYNIIFKRLRKNKFILGVKENYRLNRLIYINL